MTVVQFDHCGKKNRVPAAVRGTRGARNVTGPALERVAHEIARQTDAAPEPALRTWLEQGLHRRDTESGVGTPGPG